MWQTHVAACLFASVRVSLLSVLPHIAAIHVESLHESRAAKRSIATARRYAYRQRADPPVADGDPAADRTRARGLLLPLARHRRVGAVGHGLRLPDAGGPGGRPGPLQRLSPLRRLLRPTPAASHVDPSHRGHPRHPGRLERGLHLPAARLVLPTNLRHVGGIRHRAVAGAQPAGRHRVPLFPRLACGGPQHPLERRPATVQ